MSQRTSEAAASISRTLYPLAKMLGPESDERTRFDFAEGDMGTGQMLMGLAISTPAYGHFHRQRMFKVSRNARNDLRQSTL
jgi:hypothetical protein